MGLGPGRGRGRGLRKNKKKERTKPQIDSTRAGFSEHVCVRVWVLCQIVTGLWAQSRAKLKSQQPCALPYQCTREARRDSLTASTDSPRAFAPHPPSHARARRRRGKCGAAWRGVAWRVVRGYASPSARGVPGRRCRLWRHTRAAAQRPWRSSSCWCRPSHRVVRAACRTRSPWGPRTRRTCSRAGAARAVDGTSCSVLQKAPGRGRSGGVALPHQRSMPMLACASGPLLRSSL